MKSFSPNIRTPEQTDRLFWTRQSLTKRGYHLLWETDRIVAHGVVIYEGWFRHRLLIIEIYPDGDFDVYSPVTDANSADATWNAIDALTAPTTISTETRS